MFIRWLVIYPVDSAIHRLNNLNNWGLIGYKSFLSKENGWQGYIIKGLNVAITSTHFSSLFILRNCPKYIVLFLEPLDWNFTFLLALIYGKSGHTLIDDRAMKGSGFNTALTSQINLHWDSSLKQRCKLICDVNPVSNPFPFIARLLIKV